jgi:hypothetical protein
VHIVLRRADSSSGRVRRGGYLLNFRDVWEIYIKGMNIVFADSNYVDWPNTGP